MLFVALCVCCLPAHAFGKKNGVPPGAGKSYTVSVNSISALRASSYHLTETLIEVLGYYAPNDGGGGTYYWDAAEAAADNGGSIIKPTSVAGAGRWMLIFTNNTLNIKQFGAIDDNSTDCLPMIMNAINALRRTIYDNDPDYYSMGTLQIPSDTFYCSNAIILDGTINIIGTGAGTQASVQSTLRFEAQVPGLVFRANGAFGGTKCRVENLALVSSGGLWYVDTANGIYTDARINISNCYIYNFAGSGIVIDSRTSGTFPDLTKLTDNDVFLCRGYGIALYGYDANQCSVENNNCHANGMSNFHDESALGNYFAGNHSAYAGMRAVAGWTYGWTKTGGHSYVAYKINKNVRPGMTTGWENYWMRADNVFDTVNFQNWNADSTYYDAVPYWGGGAAQSGGYYQNYAEGGQGSIYLTENNLWIQGTVGSMTTTTGFVLPYTVRASAQQGELMIYPGGGVRVPDGSLPVSNAITYNQGFTTGSTALGVMAWRAFSSDTLARFYSNASSAYTGMMFPLRDKSLKIAGRNTTTQTPLPVFTDQGFFIADANDITRWRSVQAGTAAPSTGWNGTGDFVLNTGTDMSLLGWRCVMAGNPGTFEEVRTGNGAVTETLLTDTLQNYWRLSGNNVMSGYSEGSFLGSRNNASLVFRTNNLWRAVLDSTGKLGLGNTPFVPGSDVDIRKYGVDDAVMKLTAFSDTYYATMDMNATNNGDLIFNLNGNVKALENYKFRFHGDDRAILSGTGNLTLTGGLVGTTTNSNAASGIVGEYIYSDLGSGSAVSLTTGTTATITSISLTAGDWDVTGVVNFTASGATTTSFRLGSSSTAATFDGENTYLNVPLITTGLSDIFSQNIPVTRYSLSTTTTVYLVARAAFSAGSVNGYGIIRARRVR